MSTKIYYGVRFPRNRLGEFVKLVRERGRKKVCQRALEFAEALRPDCDLMREVARETPKLREWLRRVKVTMRLLGEAADQCERSHLDVESCWRVFVPLKGKYILAIPHGEHVNHVSLPKWVEEYGYWDNTDMPDHVTDRQWRSRRKAWEIACAFFPENHQMLIEVFSIEKRTRARGLDFFWLEQWLIERGLRETG